MQQKWSAVSKILLITSYSVFLLSLVLIIDVNSNCARRVISLLEICTVCSITAGVKYIGVIKSNMNDIVPRLWKNCMQFTATLGDLGKTSRSEPVL